MNSSGGSSGHLPDYQPGAGKQAAYALSSQGQLGAAQRHEDHTSEREKQHQKVAQSSETRHHKARVAVFGEDDPSGVHYTRDPKKLTAYLVPFPKPDLKDYAAAQDIPSRFLIYTPPAPPIGVPPKGQKEGRIHKLQRKWEDEVREAKTTQTRVTSWKGAKGRATEGINWAMDRTMSSSLEFLNRFPSKDEEFIHDKHSDDGYNEGETTKKTVGLEELLLFYPSDMDKTEDQIREEFVNTMLHAQSKAQKDAILATGLIPVTLATDILITVIWPFGGLVEIDTVWAVASMRGAKTARSVTKRIHSSDVGATSSHGEEVAEKATEMVKKATGMVPGLHKGEDHAKEAHLRLRFVPSPRIEVLGKYLASECHERDGSLFRSPGPAPTESNVVEAIGWSPSQTGGVEENWEDEQWELREVKDDVKQVMHKGAREWNRWVKAYEKEPEKALKK